MTGTITRTPCPKCKITGGLNTTIKFLVENIGEHSLAGGQMKATGRFLPVLCCTNCDLKHFGEFEGDHHAVFGPYGENESSG